MVAVQNDYTLRAWEWVKCIWASLRSSVAAFCRSPQVWFAAAVFAFAGYYGGFLMGARHVPRLKEDIKVLESSVALLKQANLDLKADNDKLSGPVKTPPTKRKAVSAVETKSWWQQ